MKSKKTLWHGLTGISSLLLAVSIIGAQAMEASRSQLDLFFGTTSQILETDNDDDTLYTAYTPKKEFLNADGSGNSTALIKGAIDLGRRESAEGSVLLKNNGALPLKKGSNVTLLGARSATNTINSGMGQKSQGPYITLEQALGDTQTHFDTTTVDKPIGTNFNFSDLKYGGNGVGAGAGYKVNKQVLEAYQAINTVNKLGIQERAGANFDPKEPSLADLAAQDPSYQSSFAQYGDAAIVVVGRPSGESNDYLKGSLKEELKNEAAGITEPLELTQNERDIINLATEKFDKVIVLVNTNSAIEIGDLKNNDKIDAILWIGHPGNYGFLGVADILCGNVSPSGGLYDIYATENLSAPAMMNMGRYAFTNSDELPSRNKKSMYYVIEAEGMYTGYRYYETRYYDSIVNPSSNAASTAGTYASKGNWSYADEVAYGFGYGLTYSELEYEIVGTPKFDYKPHEIYADVTVKVTNRGSVDTKANVQIYGQAPYTQYDKQNGVEKSAIQLLNYGKSDEVIPAGKSVEVTVTCDFTYFASYDTNHVNPDGTKGTYIMDAGDYYLAVGNGAHDALNNVLAAQGYGEKDGMVGSGNADLAYKFVYDYNVGDKKIDDTTFAITKSNASVKNWLETADWNYFKQEVTYLSRNDWSGTYPKEYTDMTIPDNMKALLGGQYYEVQQNDDVSEFKWGVVSETKLNFYDMVKADWDDPRWDKLVDQMTLEESIILAASGGDALPAIPGVGLREMQGTENAGNGVVYKLGATKTPQVPWAISSEDVNADWNGQVFPSAPVMASAFNPDLMKELGEFVGNEALFLGVPILWGPGLNTHRHAYNGRNGEYYSEDPVLSGVCAMEFAIGAADYGLIAAPKHYAFNDQETQRNGVAPYLLEARAREIELRAFQIAMEATKYDKLTGKDVGMLGLMTSFSKIGPVEVTCSVGMMDGILQQEWGFHGYAVTDISDDLDEFAAMCHAGCTGFDLRRLTNINIETLAKKLGNQIDTGEPLSVAHFENDATIQADLKASVKRTLWIIARSNIMNNYNSSTRVIDQMTWWRGAYIAAIVVTSVLTVGFAALYVVSVIKDKKEVA